MKIFPVFCAAALVLIVLISGCTSTSTQSPATVAATPVPQAAVTLVQPATTAPDITGTSWTLEWFDDTKGIWSKVAEGSTVTATFGKDSYITGSGGCNEYSTQYRLGIDPAIWIRRPDIGTKTCQSPLGVMGQESYYYTDLSLSYDYTISGGQLMMYDKTGKKILQFNPA